MGKRYKEVGRMRIAWFTPLSTKSGISRYSKSVTDQLIKYADVDIWLSKREDLLPTELKKVYFQPTGDLSQLKDYDFIVYNLGDNLEFHKDIYEISKKFSGIIILHDLVMHHFFAGYYIEHIKNAHAYARAMEQYYGEKGKNIAIDSVYRRIKPVWETEEVANYPLFEKGIEGAMGIILHSHNNIEHVKQNFLGPLTVIYHPFYSQCGSQDYGKVDRAILDLPKDKIIIVTIGYVNPNKRIDKVIEVLGEDKELAEKIIYVVIGPYKHNTVYLSDIESLIKKYKLENVVKIIGYQQEDMLHAYMSNADAFINLRMPAMESASWSVIEEMYYGKPVIVSNTGFFSEIPEDCLIKIGMDNERFGLHNALNRLIYDKEIGKIGKKARQFVIENCSVENYCNKFIKFLEEVSYNKPMIELIDKVGIELDMMGVSEDMAVVDKVAEEIHRMFGR